MTSILYITGRGGSLEKDWLSIWQALQMSSVV